MYKNETIIDTEGNPIEDPQALQSFQQGAAQGSVAGFLGTIGSMLSNPSKLQQMTTMDSKRKSDLEALGIGLGTYGIGKIFPNLPPTIKGLAAGFGIEFLENMLRKRK